MDEQMKNAAVKNSNHTKRKSTKNQCTVWLTGDFWEKQCKNKTQTNKQTKQKNMQIQAGLKTKDNFSDDQLLEVSYTAEVYQRLNESEHVQQISTAGTKQKSILKCDSADNTEQLIPHNIRLSLS